MGRVVCIQIRTKYTSMSQADILFKRNLIHRNFLAENFTSAPCFRSKCYAFTHMNMHFIMKYCIIRK